MPPGRDDILNDTTLRGAAWCEEHCKGVDRWLQTIFAAALAGADAPVALVAIGGYGRGDLCPKSDIDVILLHEAGFDAAPIADRVWYPIWDAGVRLGHSLATPAQALGLAGEDLDTATALLSVRLLGGQPALAHEVLDSAQKQWRSHAKRWLTELTIRTRERHQSTGDVAFALEPDLKDGRGGMRDVHSLRWAQQARPVLVHDDELALAQAYETLLAARVELQRYTGSASNTIVLQDRDPLAAALDLPSADELMAAIAEAGRSVSWRSDDAWRRIAVALRGPLGRVRLRTRRLADGIELRNGEVHITPAVAAAPAATLMVALAAAEAGAAISRDALEVLLAKATPIDPWSGSTRGALVALLRTGRNAIAVIEALDQVGLWSRDVLPEWTRVHALPQHNPYHQFTVDRHLLEAIANAASLASSVARPDLLVTSALLHDIGKGYPGDHTEVGVDIGRVIADRLGFSAADVDTLVALIANHLMLLDVATRRDIDDPTTIDRVASTVGSVEQLRLLAALTEADARATGPSAWTPWRADLVAKLVDSVTRRFESGSSPSLGEFGEQIVPPPPGTHRIDAADDVLTVVTVDRTGAFSRVAGALALNGLEVLSAVAYSTDDGVALSRFNVTDPLRGEPPWPQVIADVTLALEGRLALSARLAERAAAYRRPTLPTPRADAPSIRFDDDASADATVIDVHAADAIGVLYRITRALADIDIDIRSARVQTIGNEVIDAFYVRDHAGLKITDDALRREIGAAIHHALTQL